MNILKIAALSFTIMLSLKTSAASLYEVPIRDIDGQETTLNAYKGKVLLVVNVASKCGLTPQYAALEQIHKKYKAQGFTVLGFPCNQFGAQEPGSNQEIKEFCSLNYKVTFPMFDKLDVNGKNRHALYQQLAGSNSPFPGDIKWNFAKFLVSRDGKILKRFDPAVKPDAPEVIKAIEQAIQAEAKTT